MGERRDMEESNGRDHSKHRLAVISMKEREGIKTLSREENTHMVRVVRCLFLATRVIRPINKGQYAF